MPALLLLAAIVVPDFARVALESTPPMPGATLGVDSYVEVLPAGCVVDHAEVLTRSESDGRTLLRLLGPRCTGLARVSVRWTAEVLVTRRAIAVGESLVTHVLKYEQRDVTGLRSPLTELPEGALASHALKADAVVLAADVRSPGPVPGDRVVVACISGGIVVRETGTLVPCAASRSCALLPSGRRVEGRFASGELVVELP